MQRKTLRICRGNNFALKLDVEKLHAIGGVTTPEDFDLESCQDVKVIIKSRTRTIEANISYEGKHLTIIGDPHYEVGMYDFELRCVTEDGSNLLFSEPSVFSIVANSRDADIPENVEFNVDVFYLGVIAVQMWGHDGTDGLSAYEIAVKHGFVGTEEEWLASLTPDLESLRKDLASAQASIHALSLGAKLTLSASPTVVKKNASTSVRLTASFSGVTPDSMAIYDGDEVLASDELKASVVATISRNMSGDKSYRAVAMYNGMQFNSSVNVAVRDCILYGFCGAYSTPTKELSARTSAVATYEDTASANGQVFCIYVPNGVTAPTKFSMGGAPAVFNRSTKVVGGITYTVFTSGETYNSGTRLTIKAE